MLRKSLITAVLLLAMVPVFAMEVAVSHCIFYLPDPIYKDNMNPYAEFYWQINPNTLRYNTNADKKIIARIATDVVITNDTGKLLKEDHYILQTRPADNVNDIPYLNVMELKRYFMMNGGVHFKMRLTDLNDTTNQFVFADTFTIRPQPKRPFISDIELVDTFYASDIRTPFRKNGIQFIPLCQPFFDNWQVNLSYFSEVYHTHMIPKKWYPLVTTVAITKQQGFEPVPGFSVIDTVRDSLQPYIYGTIPIEKLKSGNYFLNISITAADTTLVLSKSIFFQRLNKRKTAVELPLPATTATQPVKKADTGVEKVDVVNLEKTFLAKYTTPQVKAMMKMILPVVDKDVAAAIRGFLKRPDELYMRYLVLNYFKSLDAAKPERAWKNYSERIKEVNKLFGGHGRMGYETDRGFMYLRYGAPSTIVTEPAETNALPYEIWQYNSFLDQGGKLQTNALMLFYKRNATDFEYVLLHTNISGELHNMDWRNYLYQIQDDFTKNNSRAEFFIGNR